MSKPYLNKDISWENCPFDILLLICRKLDAKSLANTMFVNKHWQDVVEYYCKHFKMWKKMVKQVLNDTDLDFREKSVLRSREILFRLQQWYNIKNAAIRLHHHITFDIIRSICVNKDNLIVVTNKTVKYYDIETLNLVKVSNYLCTSFEETSSLCALLVPKTLHGTKTKTLTLYNKLHHKGCRCYGNQEKQYLDIKLYKVHLDCCYTLDACNILWIDKTFKCYWHTMWTAKYYGGIPIRALHVHGENVYGLLKSGGVLCIDNGFKKFSQLSQLSLPKVDTGLFYYMFHTFSVLCAAPSDKQLEIYLQKKEGVIVVACPGLTCAKEHGHVLLMGYDNGKIEIYLKHKLLQNIKKPERCFYLQSYTKTLSNKITVLDIYEGTHYHHLFVKTDCHVYEILIFEK